MVTFFLLLNLLLIIDLLLISKHNKAFTYPILEDKKPKPSVNQNSFKQLLNNIHGQF